ncbi:hypothetical protein Ms3S1_13900 [Methylosinus sp. 3S-1]
MLDDGELRKQFVAREAIEEELGPIGEMRENGGRLIAKSQGGIARGAGEMISRLAKIVALEAAFMTAEVAYSLV